MNAIIDTSSLLALVKYYLPFDQNRNLKKLIEEKFNNGDILLIDKVFEESKFVARKIIVSELDFLNDKSKHIKTNNLYPDNTFFNLLDNQFCDKDVKKAKDISEVEFELEKKRFLNTADGCLILYSYFRKNDDIILVTEETRSANDNKIFKKLPENCELIGVKHCSLPILIKEYYQLELSNYLK